MWEYRPSLTNEEIDWDSGHWRTKRVPRLAASLVESLDRFVPSIVLVLRMELNRTYSERCRRTSEEHRAIERLCSSLWSSQWSTPIDESILSRRRCIPYWSRSNHHFDQEYRTDEILIRRTVGSLSLFLQRPSRPGRIQLIDWSSYFSPWKSDRRSRGSIQSNERVECSQREWSMSPRLVCRLLEDRRTNWCVDIRSVRSIRWISPTVVDSLLDNVRAFERDPDRWRTPFPSSPSSSSILNKKHTQITWIQGIRGTYFPH